MTDPGTGSNGETGGGSQDGPKPPPSGSAPEKESYVVRALFLGSYILITGILSIYALFVVWPAGPDTQFELPDVTVFGIQIWQWSTDARYGAVVALAGAVGSYVHLGSSFVRHAGVGDLSFSWTWWYIHRPWIGMALALLFYFLLRGGLLATGSGGELNIYGLAGVGGLVGLSSNQATNKLKELFDTLLKVANNHNPGQGGGSARDDSSNDSEKESTSDRENR